MKKVLITGINGQDGSYLAELLLAKGYEVHGFIRRTSEPLMDKISHLYDSITLHHGDMTDSSSIHSTIKVVQPDEIYNLAAMSHVGWSFKNPEYTFDVNTQGLIRIIEAVRTLGLESKIYQACSSEMFGKVQEVPQSETTPFYPRSTYGASKVAAYHIAKIYREAYGIKIYCGILFNHESERRGEEFLSRKVCKAVARISQGKQQVLTVGNMDAKRDWGYAKDYMDWVYKIMQTDTPDDYVIATGKNYSVREWIEHSFGFVDMRITWTGKGVNEKGYDQYKELRVMVSEEFYRPAEVDTLIGDYSKSKRVLGFKPKTSFFELVRIMVQAELDLVDFSKMTSFNQDLSNWDIENIK